MFTEIKCKNCHQIYQGETVWKFCPLCGKPVIYQDNRRKRRGNGQGTVEKLGVNNWKAVAVVGWKDPTHPIRRTKTGFKTKAEALQYVDTLKRTIAPVTAPMPLHEVYESFMSTHNKSKSTLDCYASAYKYMEKLWYVPFNTITIDEWQKVLDDCPKGKRTKENIRALISLMYKWAIPRGQASDELSNFKGEWLKINVEEDLHEKRGFTDEELTLLWNHKDIPFVQTILVMCYTGFRLGEFMNLKYEDGCLIGGSKTEAGMNRKVPIAPVISEFVPSALPEKMTEKTFRNKFYDTLATVGIKNDDHSITPHSTRHTFATFLKRINAPDEDKLKLIGHTSTEMLRYYQDTSLEDLRKIVEQFY